MVIQCLRHQEFQWRVQSCLSFDGLEGLLRGLPASVYRDQCGQRRWVGVGDSGSSQLASRVVASGSSNSTRVPAVATGARAQALPRPFRQSPAMSVSARVAPAEEVVTGYGQHIAKLVTNP